MMSGFYGIDTNREVIRVHVKKCDGLMQPEVKKFSIDPQITSFEMLQNILAKAFDIKSDLVISYLSEDNGQETYLTMLSDWDMDAAIQNASDPCLRLKVDLKPFDDGLEDWDVIAPVEIPQNRLPFLERGKILGNLTGTLSDHVGRTFSTMQRVMGIKSEEAEQYRPVKTPMTDMEFRNYLDSDGHMVKPEEFRLSIYQGGVEPALRRVVWRHLLNIYPEDLSGRERFDYMKKKESEYFELRDKWIDLFKGNRVSEEAAQVASLVKKDVLRTDRTHKFYSGGDDSKNLRSLYNLLVTYALTHPEVSYCQGMSDIASPLLVVQKEEAQAYLCFCGLMKRLRSNFLYNGEAITTKLQHLSYLVHVYDEEFHLYLKEHGAEDLFFCYRWLLLEMKREFPFDDALYMLEVMWSTLPPSPAKGGLELVDSDYSPAFLDATISSPALHSPTVSCKRTQYAHLLAKRRSTSTPKDPIGPKSPKVMEAVALVSEKSNNPTDKDTKTIPEDMKNGETSSQNCNNATSVENGKKGKEPEKHLSLKPADTVEISSSESDMNGNSSSVPSRETSTGNTSPGSYGTPGSETSKEESNCSRYSTISSSSLSTSQSIERFPSLISCSIEDSNGDWEDNEDTEVVHSDPCETLVEKNIELSTSLSFEKGLVINADRREMVYVDNDEEESQFHISLGENETESYKKKTNVPQIKGSFFSGMKKILSSPKRRPGRAQPALQTNSQGQAKSSNSSSDSSEKGKVTKTKLFSKTSAKSSKKSTTSEESAESSENTLFDLKMTSSMQPDGKIQDSDSGNGSLTSSSNSSHSKNNKNSSKNISVMKNKAKLDLLEVNGGNIVGKQNTHYVSKSDNGLNSIPSMNPSISGGSFKGDPVFCENHFEIDSDVRTDETKEVNDEISECMEVMEVTETEGSRFVMLPSPDIFGYGNPFLMFLCLTVLVQHRHFIMKGDMEYDELAMCFDKMVRKHNVHKVLHQTRYLYTEYIRIQQKMVMEKKESEFSV